MTQTNVNTGKTRPVRNKTAHRHSDAVHVHPTGPGKAPPAPPAAPAEKKSSFIGRWMARGALGGAIAAAGT